MLGSLPHPTLAAWWPQCGQKSPGDIGVPAWTRGHSGKFRAPNTTQKHRSNVHSVRATSVPGRTP